MNSKLKIIIGIELIMSIILVSGCIEEPQQNKMCFNSSSSAPFFIVQNASTDYMDALLEESELVLDDNGCIRMGGSVLPVWPYGYSLSTDEDGVIHVIDDKGKHVARVGDKIKVGGGPGGKCPKHCKPCDRCPGYYWIVGEIIK